MSEVRVEVRRTRGDIFKGILANSLHSPSTLAWCVIGALIVAAIAITVNGDEGLTVMLMAGAIVFAGMLLVHAVVLLFCIWLAALQTWRARGALDTIRYTFSDQGLAIEAASGHGLSHWDTFKRAFETRSLLVIRHQMNLVHILPKRDLAADALQRVRAVLSVHVKDVRFQSTEQTA